MVKFAEAMQIAELPATWLLELTVSTEGPISSAVIRGRQEGVRDLKYLRIHGVEDVMRREHGSLALPTVFTATVEARMSVMIVDEQRSTR